MSESLKSLHARMGYPCGVNADSDMISEWAAESLSILLADAEMLDWLESQMCINTDPPELYRVPDGSFAVGDTNHCWYYGTTLREAIGKAKKP